MFTCYKCSKGFKYKQNLIRHERTCGTGNSTTTDGNGIQNEKKNCVTCRDCKKIFGRLENLRIHVKEAHNVHQEVQQLKFLAKQDFEAWKKCIEKENLCHYIKKRSNEDKNGIIRSYFYCHRTGFFRSESTGVRRIKSQGSNKIDGTCTSTLVVIEYINNIDVVFHKTHFGHGSNLGRCYLTPEERAGRIADGVMFNELLDQIRDNVENVYDPKALITRRNFLNIQRNYDLTPGMQHSSDFISVKLWINKMEEVGEENPIIYYQLTDNDLFLIIGNRFQKEMLREYGCQKICIDTTHGVNECDINLTSIVVVDEYGNGFPCIFCFSSKKDTKTWTTLFEKIRNDVNIGTIETQVFMSDDDPAFYNAWVSVMGPAQKRLLCSWHVDQSWRRNIQSKVENKDNNSCDKKSLVYKTLKLLHHEPNEEKFTAMAEAFLDELRYDEDTKEFGVYFKNNYMNRITEWAYCHIKSTGISTNMYLESIHKSIKYFYLNGRKIKRMDSCINALLKFIRDQIFSQFIKRTKNNYTSKSNNITKSHTCSKEIDSSRIKKTSDATWEIPSCSRKNVIYEVRKVRSRCDREECYLNCKLCIICTHLYTCNCVDHVLRNNICKHIHSIAQLRLPQDRDDFSQDIDVPDVRIMQFEDALVNHPTNKDDKDRQDILLKVDTLKGILMKNEYSFNELKSIRKALDNLINLLAKKKRKIKVQQNKNKEPTNKRVDRQIRFKRKSVKKLPLQASQSINEIEAIKNAFQSGHGEARDVLYIHGGNDQEF